MKRKIILGLVVIFIGIQFFQPAKNSGNPTGPNDILQTVSVPENVLSILKKSCYDCHSNHTVYPWYDHVTPVNWWLKNHIDEGKAELNFTVFSNYDKRRQQNKLKEIAETIQADEMPLASYRIMHSDAKLSGIEKQQVIEWAKTATNQILAR